MRRGRVAAIVASLAIGLLAASADAGTIRLQDDNDGGGVSFRQGGGGEFLVDVFTGPSAPASMGPGMNTFSGHGLFQTFCVEHAEGLSFNATYYYDVNTRSVESNSSAPGGFIYRDLELETAYLFTQFYNGVLSNYSKDVTDGSRSSDAAQLQNAIWFLQGGQVGAPTAGTKAADWVTEAQNATSGPGATFTSIGNVRILNLYTMTATGARGTEIQDQLVMIPLPPAALAGLALLGGLGLLRLKRRRHATI